MSAVKIEVKKYGQITQVYVDGKMVGTSAMTIKATCTLIKNVLTAMNVENWEVAEAEK